MTVSSVAPATVMALACDCRMAGACATRFRAGCRQARREAKARLDELNDMERMGASFKRQAGS